ncbi:MAG TPA: type II secretion system protein GspC [Gammaproteobacteria bacterium]|nr:type II secretion system protein GspC [Gammaproteobacteria bacterium]
MGDIQKLDDSMQINGLHMADAQAILRRVMPVAERRLPLWIGMLLGLLVAWTLAQLTWALLPRPHETTPIYKSRAAVAPSFDANKLANMHLFGEINVSATTNAPATTLNLILRGIVASSRNSNGSFAIISSNGIEEMYTVGAQLPGGAQIQSIYPDRVLLNLNGRIQSLQLPKAAGATAAGGDNMVSPISAPSVVYGSNLPGTRNLGQLRNDLLRHPEHLLDVMRAMPVMENGKLSGYRVFPVGNSDAFAKLGLKPGDVVTAVNGMPLDNPAESMSILNKLKTSEQISITYTRNGQQQTQVLQMQDSNTQ